MRGNLILNLAMSLDGFIADENGGFDWIKGHNTDNINTTEKFDFSKFLNYNNKENIINTLNAEKNDNKNIFLFGGGIMIDLFIKNDMIDEYIIGIIPIILGKGKKLFLDNNPQIRLNLKSYIIDNGIVILNYKK